MHMLCCYTISYEIAFSTFEHHTRWTWILATKTRDFDKILLSSIDDALNSLGESVKQSIYFHIENKFCVARNEIPENIEEFQGGLEKIFGTGARFIEIMIMKNLHSKIGLPLNMDKKEQLEFAKYIGAAKQGFLKKSHRAKTVKNNS
jgi:hypothetical protein